MPQGNRIQIAGKVDDFQTKKEDIDQFLSKITSYKTITDKQKQWCYEYAIIRLYCAFEELMLEALKGALNDNANYFLQKNNITQIEHLNSDVAEYVIVGEGYFDFKGRDGLIKTLKKYLPDNHWLIEIVKQEQYKTSLEKLSAFRNYAAHSGNTAKSKARKTVNQKSISQAGTWLSKTKGKQTRYAKIAGDLHKLSESVRSRGNIKS